MSNRGPKSFEDIEKLDPVEKQEKLFIDTKKLESQIEKLEEKTKSLQDSNFNEESIVFRKTADIDGVLAYIIGTKIKKLSLLGANEDYVDRLSQRCEKIIDILDELNNSFLIGRKKQVRDAAIARYDADMKEELTPRPQVYSEREFFGTSYR